MNCVKVLVAIFCLLLEILSINCSNIVLNAGNCSTALTKLLRGYDSCAPFRFQVFEIIYLADQYYTKSIDAATFSTNVTEFCVTLKNATQCSLGKISNINSDCRNDDGIEHFVNLMQIIKRLEEAVCADAVAYEIVNDSGYGCLENLKHKFGECSTEEGPALVDTGNFLANRHVCNNLQYVKNCGTQFFETCSNSGQILKYLEQISMALVQDFNCVQ